MADLVRTQTGIERKDCAFPQCIAPASFQWVDGNDVIAVCVQHDLYVRTCEEAA